MSNTFISKEEDRTHETEHLDLKGILQENSYKAWNAQNSGETELRESQLAARTGQQQCTMSVPLTGLCATCIRENLLCLLQAGCKHLPCTFEHSQFTVCAC